MNAADIDDEGFSLIELIVTLAITALILAGLSVMFVNGIRAQAQATDRDSATGASNTVAASILTSIRNSTEFTVSGNNQTLVAKVARPGQTPVCRAWTVTSSGDVYFKESTTVISSLDLSSWGRLVDGRKGAATGALKVRNGSNADGSAKFTRVDADGDGRTDAFSRSGQTLTFEIDVTRGSTTVAAANAVSATATSSTGATCW